MRRHEALINLVGSSPVSSQKTITLLIAAWSDARSSVLARIGDADRSDRTEKGSCDHENSQGVSHHPSMYELCYFQIAQRDSQTPDRVKLVDHWPEHRGRGDPYDCKQNHRSRKPRTVSPACSPAADEGTSARDKKHGTQWLKEVARIGRPLVAVRIKRQRGRRRCAPCLGEHKQIKEFCACSNSPIQN
jgi:hypothetical protein